MSDRDDQDLSLNQVTEIVSAYVSNNSVPTDQLSELITSVHQALTNVDEKPPEKLEPAVMIIRWWHRNMLPSVVNLRSKLDWANHVARAERKRRPDFVPKGSSRT